MDKIEKQFSLPRSSLIKKRTDIEEVLGRGKRISGKIVNLYCLTKPDKKFAVLVGKRLGGAVRRNRMKRLVREIYRIHPLWFEAQWTVILVKKFLDDYHAIEKDIEKLVNKL